MIIEMFTTMAKDVCKTIWWPLFPPDPVKKEACVAPRENTAKADAQVLTFPEAFINGIPAFNVRLTYDGSVLMFLSYLLTPGGTWMVLPGSELSSFEFHYPSADPTSFQGSGPVYISFTLKSFLPVAGKDKSDHTLSKLFHKFEAVELEKWMASSLPSFKEWSAPLIFNFDSGVHPVGSSAWTDYLDDPPKSLPEPTAKPSGRLLDLFVEPAPKVSPFTCLPRALTLFPEEPEE